MRAMQARCTTRARAQWLNEAGALSVRHLEARINERARKSLAMLRANNARARQVAQQVARALCVCVCVSCCVQAP